MFIFFELIEKHKNIINALHVSNNIDLNMILPFLCLNLIDYQ